MTTGKTIALTRQTFGSKVMSLLFNMLSRLVIAFLPRSKVLLISWLQSPSAVILEPKKIKSITVFILSSSICHEVMEPDTMILVFWMLSFKPTFSLSSFTFIKRLFSSSLSAIKVVLSVYLRLLIFLQAILILACASSSLAFHMHWLTQWWRIPLPMKEMQEMQVWYMGWEDLWRRKCQTIPVFAWEMQMTQLRGFHSLTQAMMIRLFYLVKKMKLLLI